MSSREYPFYDGCAANIEKTDQGNYGLWFERFYNYKKISEIGSDEDIEKTAKSAWLKRYFHEKDTGDKNQLQYKCTQQIGLVKKLNGKSWILENVWHFVTGMGNPHPVENGFLWHPTLGTPYLPASAIKGTLRALVELYFDESVTEEGYPSKNELLLRWFGSNNKDTTANDFESRTGDLIFFDAIPVEPVKLSVDIMTPHMGDWYQEGSTISNINEDNKIPADWHSPTPIAYLTANNPKFLFSVAIRPSIRKQAEIDILKEEFNEVLKALNHSLKYIGIGSKTAVNYGFWATTEYKKLDSLKEKANENLESKEVFLKNIQEADTFSNKNENEKATCTLENHFNIYMQKQLKTKEDENKLKAAMNSLITKAKDWTSEHDKEKAIFLLNKINQESFTKSNRTKDKKINSILGKKKK